MDNEDLPGLIQREDVLTAFGMLIVAAYFIGDFFLDFGTTDEVTIAIVISALLFVYGEKAVKAISEK